MGRMITGIQLDALEIERLIGESTLTIKSMLKEGNLSEHQQKQLKDILWDLYQIIDDDWKPDYE